jgi:predicted nicotinamide N-methyase
MLEVDLEDHRFLEVGCGIGLASLILNHRGADITAMDYHPEAGAFLARNSALNGDPGIPFLQSDWTRNDDRLGRFSMIIGSDLLYEKEHAQCLAEFIQRHRTDNCTVIIADPGRGFRGRFARAMQESGSRYEHEDTSGVQVMTFSFGQV